MMNAEITFSVTKKLKTNNNNKKKHKKTPPNPKYANTDKQKQDSKNNTANSCSTAWPGAKRSIGGCIVEGRLKIGKG